MNSNHKINNICIWDSDLKMILSRWQTRGWEGRMEPGKYRYREFNTDGSGMIWDSSYPTITNYMQSLCLTYFIITPIFFCSFKNILKFASSQLFYIAFEYPRNTGYDRIAMGYIHTIWSILDVEVWVKVWQLRHLSYTWPTGVCSWYCKWSLQAWEGQFLSTARWAQNKQNKTKLK